MKYRNILIALAILVGLAAYVYLVEIKGEKKRQQEKEASERVFPHQAGEVMVLSVSREASEVRLVREADTWRIEAPVSTGADTDAVERFLGSLVDLKIERELENIEDLEPYNLAEPPVLVELSTTDQEKPERLSGIWPEAAMRPHLKQY